MRQDRTMLMMDQLWIHDPKAIHPCKRCRIQADPRIQGPRSLGVVQDPKGSNDPIHRNAVADNGTASRCYQYQ